MHKSDKEQMLPRVKFLLVDDLDENLLALSALLRRDDVELLQARSGFEALEYLLVHDVALAFIDVQMPDMDGFELAELIRGSERTRHVPLIFVTAGVRDERRLFKGYESGAVDFLYKPIEPHILRNKAEVFFQLYRQKQQLALELHERTETLRLNEMFVAILGHDLRNPLGAILTAATLLQRSLKEDINQKATTQILNSGKRMGRLIDDMLDLARARLAGGIALTRTPMRLDEAVQRVVQEFQAGFPHCRIETRVEGDMAGEWDADRLAQVAANLIGNAARHGDNAEPVQVISTAPAPTPSSLRSPMPAPFRRKSCRTSSTPSVAVIARKGRAGGSAWACISSNKSSAPTAARSTCSRPMAVLHSP